MTDYNTWLLSKNQELHSKYIECREQLLDLVSREFSKKIVTESAQASRYSIHVDYRTDMDEVLVSFSKLVLGYVSAGLKKMNFHTKHVFDEKPLRLLVSSRNWDDGEWVGIVSWNEKERCFLVSKGYYNKDRKTVSVQSTSKCSGTASDITKDVSNMMHHLKTQPDRHVEKMKPVPLKRGPK